MAPLPPTHGPVRHDPTYPRVTQHHDPALLVRAAQADKPVEDFLRPTAAVTTIHAAADAPEQLAAALAQWLPPPLSCPSRGDNRVKASHCTENVVEGLLL